MILRDATGDDAEALAAFDLGGPQATWIDEVAEIVGGLLSWQHDQDHRDRDRRVIVAETDNQIVAVGAHECMEHETLGLLSAHRYVMVVAVRASYRRTGVGSILLESMLVEMQDAGVVSASWLVHPANLASIAFCRTNFIQADETYSADDRPYVRFTLWL